MPLALILKIGAGLFVGVTSLQLYNKKVPDFVGPPRPPVEPILNPQSEKDISFFDNLSLKESIIGLSLISVILFSKPWK